MPRHKEGMKGEIDRAKEQVETAKELVTMQTFEEMEVPLKDIIVEIRNLEELIRVRAAGMTEVLRAFTFKTIPIMGQITEMKGQYTRALEQASLLGKEEQPSVEEWIAEKAKEKELSDELHKTRLRDKKPQEVSDGDEG